MYSACTEFHEMDYRNKIQVDEVALNKNPVKPRLFWQLGQVVELHLRSDEKLALLPLGKEMGQ